MVNHSQTVSKQLSKISKVDFVCSKIDQNCPLRGHFDFGGHLSIFGAENKFKR